MSSSESIPASAESAGQVTLLMRAASKGDGAAASELLPLVYDRLRAIARERMRQENVGHTLQATALVHEAYMRLVGDEAMSWSSRAGFYCAAAQAMRRILIDHARKRGRVKRGGGLSRQPLDAVDLAITDDADDVLALDTALTRLAEKDPRAAKIVELRFYAGLSVEETASALELSDRTVKREWSFARAWLFKELGAE